jgi:hypothetical protein
VDGKWHIDGHYFQHYLFSKEIGLLALIYFSDVKPNGGGTAIAEGSHLTAIQILSDYGVKGLTSTELAAHVMNSNVRFNIVECTGSAGDVILLHPLLLHARSSNCETVNVENIRFLCHPCIPLKQHMDFAKPFARYSILEKSMVIGVARGFSATLGNEFNGQQDNFLTDAITDIINFSPKNSDHSSVLEDNEVQISLDNETDTSITSHEQSDHRQSVKTQYDDNYNRENDLHFSLKESLRTLRMITPERCQQYSLQQSKRKIFEMTIHDELIIHLNDHLDSVATSKDICNERLSNVDIQNEHNENSFSHDKIYELMGFTAFKRPKM